MQPIPAYPHHFTPAALNVQFQVHFVGADGTVVELPDTPLVAGTCGTWVLTLRNLERDLPRGAVITLIRQNIQIAYRLQMDRPHGRDYCTLETDSQARLRLLVGRSAVNLLSVLVEDGIWRRGESCVIRLGDRRQGGAGAEVFWSTTTATFLLAVDPTGSGQFWGAASNPLTFQVVAHHQPARFQLLGPTVATCGEPFTLHLAAFDRNRNLVDRFTGAVTFRPQPGVTGLPASYRFTPQDGGLALLENVRVHRPGVYRLAGVAENGLAVTSNPIVVQEAPACRVYWGDVHAHGWGDSTMYLMFNRTDKLDPLARHRQGRTVGRFDFACPAAMSMDPERREEVWDAYRAACAATDEPGVYVPFLAYEAHPTAGDRQVIFRDYADEPLPLPMRAPMEEVDAAYGQREDVLLQVHIGGDPPRWDRYRPDRERLLEICSGFGCAEWLLQRALRLGYRPAICGASDLHLGLMGAPRAVETFRGRFGQKFPMRQRDAAYGSGPVTAILAPELNRNALWAGLVSGQTYATSGARLYLDVRANSQPPGSEVKLASTLQLAVACHACAPLDRVDLIVGEYCVRSWEPHSLDFRLDLTLAADQLPGSWLYLRLHQVDGEYAWSSPIWLEHPGPLPSPGNLPRWNAQETLDLGAFGENAATPHLADLQRYLSVEEDPTQFHHLTPVDVLELSMGRCALFYCTWSEEHLPMSIRWFFEFEIPKIRYDLGWRDYGAFDEFEYGPRLMAAQAEGR